MRNREASAKLADEQSKAYFAEFPALQEKFHKLANKLPGKGMDSAAEARLETILREHGHDAKSAKESAEKIAREGRKLPLLVFLKACLPKTKQDGTLFYYWQKHLKEAEGGSGGEIQDQTGRMIGYNDFPHAFKAFTAAYKQRGEAWRKSKARTDSDKGGEKSVRISRKEGVVLRKQDKARIQHIPPLTVAPRRKKV